MLRITTLTNPGTTTLQLEGKLTSPWTEELHRCWQEMIDAHQQQVLIDLSGVTFIDADGKALLTHLWQQGATFHAAGCLNTSIVEEITTDGRTYASGRTETP